MTEDRLATPLNLLLSGMSKGPELNEKRNLKKLKYIKAVDEVNYLLKTKVFNQNLNSSANKG